jgi:hypothetical protein
MGRVRMLAGEGAEVGGGAGTTEIEHAECLVACTQARFLAIWLTDLGANPSLHDTQSAPIAWLDGNSLIGCLLRARLAEFVSRGAPRPSWCERGDGTSLHRKNGAGKFGQLSPKPLPYLLSCFLLLQRVNIYCPLFYWVPILAECFFGDSPHKSPFLECLVDNTRQRESCQMLDFR